MDTKPSILITQDQHMIAKYLAHYLRQCGLYLDSDQTIKIKNNNLSNSTTYYTHWIDFQNNTITIGHTGRSWESAQSHFTTTIEHPQAFQQIHQWIIDNPNQGVVDDAMATLNSLRKCTP